MKSPDEYLFAFMSRIRSFGLYQSSDFVAQEVFPDNTWNVKYVGVAADRYANVQNEDLNKVNTVMLNVHHKGKEHVCDIVSLWLNPSFRNSGQKRGIRGYGTRLLDCVEGFAKDVHCTIVRVQPADIAAKIKFYDNHEYVKQGNDQVKRFVRNA